ncbi:MAG: hypothetical protein ABS63_08120 [Microbacterium sp. SCN 70-27]|nr:MAG: hypothetical protein ABS63_08120 [Microbacterium sp. SCN 70-27]
MPICSDQEAPSRLVQRAAAIADVCAEHGTTLPAAAIAFPLRADVVTSVVIGMRGTDQVACTMARYDAPPPDALWADLESRGLLGN